MGRKSFVHLLMLTTVLLLPVLASGQILGPCGGSADNAKNVEKIVMREKMIAPMAHEMAIRPIPLPGQRALDFQLTAVVGNDIKTVKLSDSQGKWRVVCFFPAAFTFV